MLLNGFQDLFLLFFFSPYPARIYSLFGFFFFFLVFWLFGFLGPHLLHMEVPRLGVKLEL